MGKFFEHLGNVVASVMVLAGAAAIAWLLMSNVWHY